MAGNVKLLTSAGGGVVLDTATTTATDVTVKVPVTGVNNGTLVCSNSSGNVGIGTSSPGQKLQVTTDFGVTSVASANYYVQAGGGVDGGADAYLGLTGGTTNNGNLAIKARGSGGMLMFFTGGTNGAVSSNERMRITSNGNLLVGATALPSATVEGFVATGTNSGNRTSSGSSTAAYNHWLFYNGNGLVGNINTSGTATAYVTSSDYRLKENIQPMQGALDVVAQLNPVTYTWKADGSDGQGFIAHELQAVVPDCVTGEKDAVDEEGNPVYQGIDTSFLVATLTKAIQELSAKNDALEERIAALEAK